MVLYFIGIGLNDEKDISLKGLNAVKTCKEIYLESYTSKLSSPVANLEKLYGNKIIIADRELVEKNSEKILTDAKKENIAFLVIGDVFSATTHVDLMLRAKEQKIPVKVIHNASVLTAVGITGLELYKFGKTTSIPFHNENVKSPIDVMKNNQKLGLHTLFLLDLDPINEKYLSIKKASQYLIKNNVKKDTLAVGCAKLGSVDQVIKAATLEKLSSTEINKFPGCLIVPGKLHFMEEEALELYK